MTSDSGDKSLTDMFDTMSLSVVPLICDNNHRNETNFGHYVTDKRCPDCGEETAIDLSRVDLDLSDEL